MSLRTALRTLPDDRGTSHAVREIVACFAVHVGEPLSATRISHATGLEVSRVVPVLTALSMSAVVDCDGDLGLESCSFEPDAVLKLEVERYLRSGGPQSARMQSSLGKFRSRFGRG